MEIEIIEIIWAHLHGVYQFGKGTDKSGYGIPDGYRHGTYAMEDSAGVSCLALAQGIGNGGRGIFDRDAIESGSIGLTYPARVFVWAHDGRFDCPFEDAMSAIRLLDLRPHDSMWWRRKLLHGYAGGTPLFHNALMAHTDVGARWHDVETALRNAKVKFEVIDKRSGGKCGEFWNSVSLYIDHAVIKPKNPTAAALEVSIAKYRKAVTEPAYKLLRRSFRSSTCPLCKLFLVQPERGPCTCHGCPVAAAGYDGCEGTPWDTWPVPAEASESCALACTETLGNVGSRLRARKWPHTAAWVEAVKIVRNRCAAEADFLTSLQHGKRNT